MKIEPLYKVNTAAVFWFNQWTLFKVYQGLYSTIDQLEVSDKINLKFSRGAVSRIINNIEFRNVEILENDATLSVEELEAEIIQVLKLVNKTHCVLLLDDAAHAFSPEQQRDFFEFFREIKSRYISPKAAVYPGVTIYSSTFHVGHDAEEIDVWINPETDHYIPFMEELLRKRLPELLFNEFKKKEELLHIVCYCAFGIPRNLLNMLRSFYKEDEENNILEIKFTRKTVNAAVKVVLQQTMKIYTSLRIKLPTYEKFIAQGDILYDRLITLVKEYNKGKESHLQAISVGIQRPIPAELTKVLGFFQYGGLLVPKGDVSRGENGTFELYAIHYGALYEHNAFLSEKKNVGADQLLMALSKRNAHSFRRITPNILLGNEDVKTLFPLSLPPCHICKSPRISEHSKFCNECETPLQSFSIFEKLVSSDISVLPLTANRIKSIKEATDIRAIKDILMDTENRKLRSVPQIGATWSQRIYSYAEEYIG